MNRLSSSRKFTSQTAAVCPNETVYLRCVSNSIHGLEWHLPSEVGLQSVSYLPGDPVHNIERVGPIMIWLEESQPVLRSYVMIPYSPALGETTISCESGKLSKSVQYQQSCKIILFLVAKCILALSDNISLAQADTIPAPDVILESTFSIDTEEYFKVEWTPMNHASYYFVLMYWSETDSYEVIETTHTSIIRARKPTQFSISSVNECGVKSTATGRLGKDMRLSIIIETLFQKVFQVVSWG